jgi:hypothetical protein
MQSSNFSYQRVLGANTLEEFLTEPTIEVFNQTVVDFFAELSKELIHKKFFQYPGIVSLGFFCRRANLALEKNKHSPSQTDIRVGRGVTIHYTPSNMPMNFAYSLIAGLLSGNSCLIKLSKIETQETALTISVLNNLLEIEKFKLMKNRIFLMRCDSTEINNDFLAEMADVRILWGSDKTINEIKMARLGAHAYDITFPNRYSLCMISSSAYLEASEKDKIASLFFNDTFAFDQNACSSPKAVIWVGDPIATESAKTKFWEKLAGTIETKKYESPEAFTVNKLTVASELCIQKIRPEIQMDPKNGIIRATVPPDFFKISDHYKYFSAGGMFVETSAESIDKIPEIKNRKLQTITYFGFSTTEIKLLFESKKLNADRVVQFGNATTFELIWDGFDLISQMSKRLVIR